MSTWNNEPEGQQQSPSETPARFVPEVVNANSFVTEGSLAVAPDAAPAATPPAEVVPLPSSAQESAQESDVPQSEAEDIEQNKVFAIVGYLGILFLVPLLAAPNSKFARYHANQGIVLFIASVVVTGAFYILGHIPVIGRVFGFVGYLVWLAVFVLMVLGIVNAANGKCQPLPVLGKYQLLK
jgi:uncharacterized membrane protein